MTGDALPPVAVAVLAEAVDRLPARLRGRLDDATTRAAGWAVSADGDSYTVAVDDSTTVTLVTTGGAVRTPDDARCSCLLAPNCLHRAAVLASAPALAEDAGGPPDDGSGSTPDGIPGPGTGDVATGTGSATTGSGTAIGTVTGAGPVAASRPAGGRATSNGVAGAPAVVAREPAGAGSDALTPQQVTAVAHLWRAAVDVIAAGVTGSGVVARTALLRAAHDAQAAGVYRAAAAARAVASLLQSARAGAPQYRLADLADALRDLVRLLYQLRRAGDADLLGTARRRYDLRGSLRLYGLCTTAVLADDGYAGVVTYLVDRDGTMWTTSDLAPGNAQRAAGAGNATVRLGESALTHRALTRAGLIVSGATASDTRQLGAGMSVHAVTAGGMAWRDGPLAALWADPLATQVHRAFGALALPVTDRPAGDDLLFLSVRVTGSDGDAVAAVTDEGAPLLLRVATDHPAFAYRENLRLLARRPGLSMLLVGRPDPGRQATVYPMAMAPADPVGWPLPPAMAGHVDLAFDRLHRSHLPLPGGDDPGGDDPGDGDPGGDDPAAGPDDDEETAEVGTDPVGHGSGSDAEIAGEPDAWRQRTAADPALHLLRRSVERVVSGGRSVLTFGDTGRPSDARRLARARLDTGSAVLDGLTVAAVTRPRDAFGRLAGDDGTAFAQAWLAAAVYTDAAFRAFAETSWLPGPPPGTHG